MKPIKNISLKQLILGVLGFVVAFVVYFALGATDLSQQGAQCLAILVWAIFWWVGGILPEFATGLMMVIGFCLIAGVDTSISFAAFTSDTWWLLVAAFAIGAGMKSSGLMRRMALGIIRLFPKTFAAQAGALMAAGTLVGPLIPSMAAKASMLAPIAMSIGDAMGYERKDRQMQGLFAAMFSGIRTIGPAVISASVIGYTIWGLMPEDIQVQFDIVHWFVAALPWLIPCLILTFIAILALYSPRTKKNPTTLDTEDSSRDASKHDENPSILEKPGPMTKLEKRMLAIIICAVALWVTESIHGVEAHVVALAALVAMILCGVLDKQSFRHDVSWESLVFIGIAISLASVFSHVGIQNWIVEQIGPFFTQLAGNPFVFVLAIAIFTLLVRFVIVSQMALANIFLVFMVPLALQAGINPWIVGMALYVAIDPWFVLYQNPIYLAAFYAVDGQMVRHGDMAKFCLVYTIICLICLMIAVPFWQMMGLFG